MDYEEIINENTTVSEPTIVGYSSRRTRRVNRTYEAMMRLKGSLILINPNVLDL